MHSDVEWRWKFVFFLGVWSLFRKRRSVLYFCCHWGCFEFFEVIEKPIKIFKEACENFKSLSKKKTWSLKISFPNFSPDSVQIKIKLFSLEARLSFDPKNPLCYLQFSICKKLVFISASLKKEFISLVLLLSPLLESMFLVNAPCTRGNALRLFFRKMTNVLWGSIDFRSSFWWLF